MSAALWEHRVLRTDRSVDPGGVSRLAHTTVPGNCTLCALCSVLCTGGPAMLTKGLGRRRSRRKDGTANKIWVTISPEST